MLTRQQQQQPLNHTGQRPSVTKSMNSRPMFSINTSSRRAVFWHWWEHGSGSRNALGQPGNIWVWCMSTHKPRGYTRKPRGGGVLWCKTGLVRGTLCNKDIELLSVFMCPSHFPWELPQISVIVVYFHLKVNQTYALELILQTVSWHRNFNPGQFNHCSLNKTLRSFYYYVSCPNRHSKIQCLYSIWPN